MAESEGRPKQGGLLGAGSWPGWGGTAQHGDRVARTPVCGGGRLCRKVWARGPGEIKAVEPFPASRPPYQGPADGLPERQGWQRLRALRVAMSHRPPREGRAVPLCARTPAMSLAAVFREGLQGPVLPCVLCAGAGGGAELPLGEGPTLRGDRGWPLCHLLGGEGGGVQRPWWRFLRLARCWAMDEPSTPARLNVSPSVGDSKNPRTGSRRTPLHAGSVPGPTQQPGPRSQKCPLGWAPCGAVAAGGPMPGQG